MKQKLKKFLLLSLLTGTLFVSCELQEDYHSKKEYEGKMKISHKNFSELLNDRKFNKAYGEVLEKKNIMSRTVMEDQYQFTIANGLANVIETDSDITYTLLIKRDSIEENTIENLVVKIDSLNETTAYIVKFKGKQGIAPTTENLNDEIIEKVVTPIVYNSDIASKEIYECYEISYWICYYPGHTETGVCTHGQYETMEFCEVVGYDIGGDLNVGTGGDGGSGSGGGTSGTGTGSNYDGSDGAIHGNGGATPINMAPILGLGGNAPEDPCNELKKMGQNIKYSDSCHELKLNLPDKETEQGYSAKKNSALETNIVPYPQNASGMTSIKIRPTGNQYGSMHHHGKKNYQMFSCTDIFGLYQFSQIYESSFDPNYSLDMFFNTLVTFDYDYVIKIDDLTKLSTISEYFQTPEDAIRFDERIRGIYQTYGGGDNNTDYTKLEKVFLDFTNSNYDIFFNIGNHDFGISLYRRDNTLKSKLSNNWVKLELDENGVVIEKPCNN